MCYHGDSRVGIKYASSVRTGCGWEKKERSGEGRWCVDDMFLRNRYSMIRGGWCKGIEGRARKDFN
jgi:hypothetical protein